MTSSRTARSTTPPPDRRAAILGWTLAVALLALSSPAVAAAGCEQPEAHAFDFWLGEWNVVNKRLQPDGGWAAVGTATVRVHPIVGGCGVVEHWEGSLGDYWLLGFSMRTWDRRTQSWHLVLNWPPPGKPGFSELEGVFTHGRGEFFAHREGPEGEETTERYTFSDIGHDALRWDGARSEDGARWLTYWIMEFSRRPVASPPLFNGPWVADGRERRCPQDEVRALDFLAGRWRADDGEGTALEVRTIPILGGCAQIETTTAGGREIRFAARSWDLRAQRWVEYALDADGAGFERLEGGLEDGALVLESGDPAGDPAGDDDGSLRLQRSYRATDGGIEQVTRVSEDGGESWSATATWALEPAHVTPPQKE